MTKNLIKLISSESLFSNRPLGISSWMIDLGSYTMIIAESEGVNYYQDIHGRVKIPGGFNFSTSQEEPPTFESFTINEGEQINLNINPAPQRFDPVVCLDNGSIKISSERLEIGVQYQIILEDKKYLIVKSEEGVIDLYESHD